MIVFHSDWVSPPGSVAVVDVSVDAFVGVPAWLAAGIVATDGVDPNEEVARVGEAVSSHRRSRAGLR